jgi:hypothetical protein
LIETYSIAADALAQLRQHANSERRPGWEVGGKLLAEGDRLVAYERLPNLSTEPGFFVIGDDVPRPPWITVHSHPNRWHAGPSLGDVSWMRRFVRALAIYEPSTDGLVVWRLDVSRASSCRAAPAVAEARPRSRGRPLRRPGSTR